MRAARHAAAKLEPFASGAYVNALGDQGAAGVRRAYSDAKLARLTVIKDAYDPENVFHLNHNIAPSGSGALWVGGLALMASFGAAHGI